MQPPMRVSFPCGPRTLFEGQVCAYGITPSSWETALCISLPSPRWHCHSPGENLESNASSGGGQDPPLVLLALPEDTVHTDVPERRCLQLGVTRMKLQVSPRTGQPVGKDPLPFHVTHTEVILSTPPCGALRRGQWRAPGKRSTSTVKPDLQRRQ